MAIVISKSSALNDDFWKPTGQVVNAILEEADQEKNNYDELVKAIAVEKKSSKYAEKQTSVTSLDSFAITAEGADAPLDDMQEGTPKLIIHNTFQKRVDITKELVDDGDWDAIRSKARNMVLAYKRTRAEFLTAFLTGTGTTFNFGGKTGLDRTTGDSKALFATDHPSVKTGVAAQSNIFTDAFSLQNLVKLANIGRNFKNESGKVTGYTFNKIIIPGNRPELEEAIRKIIASQLEPGTDHNDYNTQKGKWQLVVNPLWTSTAEVAPYIIMSDEYNKETNALPFYDRTPLDVKSEVKIENRNLVTTGYARMGVGMYNWRAFVAGGMPTGSSLTS